MTKIQEQLEQYKLDVRSHIEDSTMADIADNKLDAILRKVVDECWHFIEGFDDGKGFLDPVRIDDGAEESEGYPGVKALFHDHFAWLKK